MNNYRNITIANYNYTLPEDRIAKYPLESRDESKMLFYNGKQIQTYPFKQISDLLQSNDLLIFNNAKVIQARMDFIKETGAHIEIFCLEPFLPGDYNLAFQAIGHCQWKCLIGNRKKWKKGKLLKKIYINNLEYCIEADLINSISNTEIVEFNWYVSVKQNDSASLSFGEILEYTGNTPLPPYLNREAEELDKSRYQTIYATQKGSVAAPTAGLHFTDEIFKSFSDKGIETDQITLHVSAGTFRPVKSESVENHEMHEEHFEVNQKTIEKLVLHKGRIISVGTTSARTLESLYRIGVKLIKNLDNPFYISQWEVYDNPSDITLYNYF